MELKRPQLIGILLFLLAPSVFMVALWRHAIDSMSSRGLEFAKKIEKPLLSDGNWEAIKGDLAPKAVGKITPMTLASSLVGYGKIKTPRNWHVVRSHADNVDDRVVSFTDLESNQDGTIVDLTVSHVMSTSEWRLEEVSVKKS